MRVIITFLKCVTWRMVCLFFYLSKVTNVAMKATYLSKYNMYLTSCLQFVITVFLRKAQNIT